MGVLYEMATLKDRLKVLETKVNEQDQIIIFYNNGQKEISLNCWNWRYLFEKWNDIKYIKVTEKREQGQKISPASCLMIDLWLFGGLEQKEVEDKFEWWEYVYE